MFFCESHSAGVLLLPNAALAEVLTLNRLIEPASEHATPEWSSRTALSDILGPSVSHIDYRDLYGNLDKLHPERETIDSSSFFKRVDCCFNCCAVMPACERIVTLPAWESRHVCNRNLRFGSPQMSNGFASKLLLHYAQINS